MMPVVQKLDSWLMQYGQELNVALIIVLGAVMVASLLVRVVQNRMRAAKSSENKVVLTTRAVSVAFTVAGVLLGLHMLGLQWVAIRRILFAVLLAGSLLVLTLRRYIPPLPFKAGDMVEVAGLLGIVESISVVNTRLKAFDGRTIA